MEPIGEALTPPHQPFDPNTPHSTPSPRSSCLEIACDIDGDGMVSNVHSRESDESPNYDYLEQENEDESNSFTASSPDYDYLAMDTTEHETILPDDIPTAALMTNNEVSLAKPREAPVENEYEYVIQEGEEYILGTLMVRVLQAKNVRVSCSLVVALFCSLSFCLFDR
jgi:hypothetical protein